MAAIPGPFAQAFLDDLPYDPDMMLFDRLEQLDVEKSMVRCRWATAADQPITRLQRNHAVLHPPHVAGALMVHATGILGFIHAYHVLGLRHQEGWIGYGTHMHSAVFRKMVVPGEPIDATCIATRSRIGKVRHFLRYAFEFRHDGDVCYKSEQSAMWLRIDADGAAQPD
jgi:3-hydroxymyristoyl/3-hydroxydecanoyl-(acyl carrier protein) dehydratase